jgi:hypothetical protein
VLFFISHAGTDRAWAEWVAWQLSEADYAVRLDVWDWAAGQNLITEMSDALGKADRVVALFSLAYFDQSRYTTQEWAASLMQAQVREQGRLIPLRIEAVPTKSVPPLLRPLLAPDLFGLSEDQARAVLLDAIGGPARPERSPRFPDRPGPVRPGGGPRLPGSVVPGIWNVPPRNPMFTGRDSLLIAIREQLAGDERAAVLALHGMGGVGKTQLALEYAHRFASSYDLVWWIEAEQPELISQQFADLAVQLGCTDMTPELIRPAVLRELRARGQWLLIFDNAEDPDQLRKWLPGAGKVLITSQEHEWAEIAVPVPVRMLARSESVAILRQRVPQLAEADADQVAYRLGDLPLAVAQAAGYLAGPGATADDYLRLLDTRAAQILAQGRPQSYPRSLAAASRLAFDRLATENPAAAQLLHICAFLAPEPIPGEWFSDALSELPEPLASQAGDPMAWLALLTLVTRRSLARPDKDGLVMHRLTQSVLRDGLAADERAVTKACADALLVAADPGDPDDPGRWSAWGKLLPHLLAANPGTSDDARLRDLADSATWYLMARGERQACHDLAESLYEQWISRLGPDDPATLMAADCLVAARGHLARYEAARALAEDVLSRRRRAQGLDHPQTLASAGNLVIVLSAAGDLAAARILADDVLKRRRRVLGTDHPDSLASASNLAEIRRKAGDPEGAQAIEDDVLKRRRRILGTDHPDTLASASNLTIILRDGGDLAAAQDMAEDVLAKYRGRLGRNHPDTLTSERNLALILRDMGDLTRARDLARDVLDKCRRVLGEDHPDTQASARALDSIMAASSAPDA